MRIRLRFSQRSAQAVLLVISRFKAVSWWLMADPTQEQFRVLDCERCNPLLGPSQLKK
jgi:hypothetical protein